MRPVSLAVSIVISILFGAAGGLISAFLFFPPDKEPATVATAPPQTTRAPEPKAEPARAPEPEPKPRKVLKVEEIEARRIKVVDKSGHVIVFLGRLDDKTGGAPSLVIGYPGSRQRSGGFFLREGNRSSRLTADGLSTAMGSSKAGKSLFLGCDDAEKDCGLALEGDNPFIDMEGADPAIEIRGSSRTVRLDSRGQAKAAGSQEENLFDSSNRLDW